MNSNSVANEDFKLASSMLNRAKERHKLMGFALRRIS